MHGEPPITIILDQFIKQPKETLSPQVFNHNLKMSEEQEKNTEKEDLVANRKATSV